MFIGLVFGVFLAVWHTLWAVLVALVLAQPFLDFIFRLHMIAPPNQVGPFRLRTAIGLVVVTAVIGYLGGYVVGLIWNRLHAKAAPA